MTDEILNFALKSRPKKIHKNINSLYNHAISKNK